MSYLEPWLLLAGFIVKGWPGAAVHISAFNCAGLNTPFTGLKMVIFQTSTYVVLISRQISKLQMKFPVILGIFVVVFVYSCWYNMLRRHLFAAYFYYINLTRCVRNLILQTLNVSFSWYQLASQCVIKTSILTWSFCVISTIFRINHFFVVIFLSSSFWSEKYSKLGRENMSYLPCPYLLPIDVETVTLLPRT